MIFTTVTTENAILFNDISPSGVLSDSELNEKYVIGTVSDEAEAPSGTGLLMFSILDHRPEAGAINAPCIRLSWLAVREGYRNKGLGRALLRRLYEIAENAGFKEVSCSFDAESTYAEAEPFFRHMGFVFTDYKTAYLCDSLGDLIKPRNFQDYLKDKGVVSLDSLKKGELEAFLAKCTDGANERSLDPDDGYDYSMCCAKKKGNEILGVLFARTTALFNGRMMIDEIGLKVLPGTPATDIKAMMIFTFGQALMHYGPDLPVRVKVINPPAVRITCHLQPGCITGCLKVGVRKL